MENLCSKNFGKISLKYLFLKIPISNFSVHRNPMGSVEFLLHLRFWWVCSNPALPVSATDHLRSIWPSKFFLQFSPELVFIFRVENVWSRYRCEFSLLFSPVFLFCSFEFSRQWYYFSLYLSYVRLNFRAKISVHIFFHDFQNSRVFLWFYGKYEFSRQKY